MITANQIRYVAHHNINKPKWDQCIRAADNGLIYACAFYLDNIAPNWHALVLNDYEVVMPLTWNRKYLVSYLFQPHFTASLGIFGSGVSGDLVLLFLQAVPKKFRYWDIDLNEANVVSSKEVTSHGSFTLRNNYFISLDQPYREVRAAYKRMARRMIKKAEDHALKVSRNAFPAQVIGFYKEVYKFKHPGIPAKAYNNLLVAAMAAFDRQKAKAYLALLPDGKIAAVYLVFVDERFVYSVIGGSTDHGKEMGAFYLLTDAVLRDFAGTGKVFRFEGSDLEGIAFFDAQFGSSLVHYLHIRLNRLPFPFRYLKK